MIIDASGSGLFLTGLVERLYAKVENREVIFPLPLKVIDSPELAKSILMSPDIFVKNYEFIEYLSKGRFSANGEDWKLRAAITQSFYSQASSFLGDDEIEGIYRKHLSNFLSGKADSLYDVFVAAALEVVSRAFHLKTPIPWPPELVNCARSNLIDLQALSWGATLQSGSFQKTQLALSEVFSEFNVLWSSHPDLVLLLKRFEEQASKIKNFNAVGEMLQNLFASTETTASSMLWIIDNLARHADQQEIIKDDAAAMDYFIDEVLRLFPPVPFVTRVCTKTTQINGVAFLKDEPILISVVGVHTDPGQWNDPLKFLIRRPEFVESTYMRHAYIPFLSGPRTCAGMKLAKQEIKSGLRAIFELFKINPCTDPRKLEYGISSRPGINLTPYLVPRT